jgi:hypothetical protein
VRARHARTLLPEVLRGTDSQGRHSATKHQYLYFITLVCTKISNNSQQNCCFIISHECIARVFHRRNYRTFPPKLSDFPAKTIILSRQIIVLSRQNYRTLPPKLSYSPAKIIVLSRQNSTFTPKFSYFPAKIIVLSRQKLSYFSRQNYRSLPAKIDDKR